MDIKIGFKNNGITEECFADKRKAAGKVLDGLWAGGADNGWVQAPLNMKTQELDFILNVADVMKQEAELLVVIGADEMTLPAKAAVGALPNTQDGIPVRFIGQNFCTAQMEELMATMSRMGTVLFVVSKDGKEPGLQASFAVLKELLEKKYENQNVERRIIVATEQGSELAATAAKEGYVTFDYPSDVPALYGALTPASIFPMAVAGIDVREFIAGAKLMATSPKWDLDGADYAIVRAMAEGCMMERISTFDSRFIGLCQWMEAMHRAKPAAGRACMTQGLYNGPCGEGIMETILFAETCGEPLMVPGSKSMAELNNERYSGAVKELCEAGRKVVQISLPKADAFEFGQLVYFLQTSSDIAASV